MKKTNKDQIIQSLDLTRVTRTVYFFIALYMLSIVIFDSGNLITREAIVDRWTAATILLVINTFVWVVASQKASVSTRFIAVCILCVGLTIFAGLTTYWERGMASTSTIFYVLPLLVIATLKNRHAIIGTAILTIGAYAFASVRYFNDFFNEGYRIQLWGSILIMSASILTAAWLIMIIAGLRHDSR